MNLANIYAGLFVVSGFTKGSASQMVIRNKVQNDLFQGMS